MNESSSSQVEEHQDLNEVVNEHSINIPRLTREEMKALKLSELSPVVMLHYHGPSKPIPPVIALKMTIHICHLISV